MDISNTFFFMKNPVLIQLQATAGLPHFDMTMKAKIKSHY